MSFIFSKLKVSEFERPLFALCSAAEFIKGCDWANDDPRYAMAAAAIATDDAPLNERKNDDDDENVRYVQNIPKQDDDEGKKKLKKPLKKCADL